MSKIVGSIHRVSFSAITSTKSIHCLHLMFWPPYENKMYSVLQCWSSYKIILVLVHKGQNNSSHKFLKFELSHPCGLLLLKVLAIVETVSLLCLKGISRVSSRSYEWKKLCRYGSDDVPASVGSSRPQITKSVMSWCWQKLLAQRFVQTHQRFHKTIVQLASLNKNELVKCLSRIINLFPEKKRAHKKSLNKKNIPLKWRMF